MFGSVAPQNQCLPRFRASWGRIRQMGLFYCHPPINPLDSSPGAGPKHSHKRFIQIAKQAPRHTYSHPPLHARNRISHELRPKHRDSQSAIEAGAPRTDFGGNGGHLSKSGRAVQSLASTGRAWPAEARKSSNHFGAISAGAQSASPGQPVACHRLAGSAALFAPAPVHQPSPTAKYPRAHATVGLPTDVSAGPSSQAQEAELSTRKCTEALHDARGPPTKRARRTAEQAGGHPAWPPRRPRTPPR